MPDHLHWLFSLENSNNLSQVVADVKRRSAYRTNEQNQRTGSVVWQPGFHDYALRKEDKIKDVARYIIANPLRAGLVKEPLIKSCFVILSDSEGSYTTVLSISYGA